MILHPHWGHDELLVALAKARVRGSFPPTLLIHGSKGVGKQHLGIWLGRLLLCTEPTEEGPCGSCTACHLSGMLEHPDFHWYFPLPRPRGTLTPDKLEQALEEARAEALEEIRARPLRPSPGGEPRGLYLAAARNLRRKAQRRPSMGHRQVFLIADAEALAPQESSSEAANALLKLLEEPPSGTTLILTASEPGRLLPTIRSRTTQLHLPPLTSSEVAEFLIKVGGVTPPEAEEVGKLSKGSIGRALGFLPDGKEPGPLRQIRAEASHLLMAALAPGGGGPFEAASRFPSVGARGLLDLLNFVEEALRDLAAGATPSASPHPSGASADWFPQVGEGPRPDPALIAAAFEAVDHARALAAGNVNPQLVIFGLLHDLRRQLTGS